MYEKIKVEVRGVVPVLLHNGQLADPLNEFSRALKAVSGKKDKTDADHEEMSRLEWFGSLYTDEGKIILPGENIEAAIIKAAQKLRLGDKAKTGVICDDTPVMIYDGPKDPEKLWKDRAFRDRRAVVIKKNRVMRTRPIFHDWKLSFTVSFLPSVINKDKLIEILRICGQLVGFGDFRPRFGRFEVVSAA